MSLSLGIYITECFLKCGRNSEELLTVCRHWPKVVYASILAYLFVAVVCREQSYGALKNNIYSY